MKLNENYFTELLELENGTPSHDCLSDIFARIDCNKFMKIFIEGPWSWKNKRIFFDL